MRKASLSREALFFLSAALLSLLASLAAILLRTRISLHNDRVVYGIAHLPVAFLAIAIFTALVAFADRLPNLATKPTYFFVAALAVVFALFWLPAWLAGGFVQDDWQLLAAASIRKIVYLHPTSAWSALDSVDGNFRPLGTVLYFGYMLRAFGLSAHAFTFGPLLLVFLGSLVAFAIVRELGYSRITASAASLLFFSRGMVYTIATWASALGDGIAILLCGLTALLVLKANKRSPAPSLALHLLAWLCFAAAMLGKQSAFVTPLIVALILFVRPGQDGPRSPIPGRVLRASAAFLIYGATAAFVFLHAKSLLRAPSPYPIGFSLKALFQSFSFATWYLVVLQFPDKFHAANQLPGLLGIASVFATLLLLYKIPALLGDRPRDILFALLAAAASVSLFVVLGTRSAPYYGCMSAFWISIALAIALTRLGLPSTQTPSPRLGFFVFGCLVVTGFAEIRLEQTGLLPSGGYIWGTFGMDTERRIHSAMQHELDAPRTYKTLILSKCPYSNPYTSMALIDAPAIDRILLYDPHTQTYTANDRQGLRPADNLTALTDNQAYHWDAPVPTAIALDLLAEAPWLRLECPIAGTSNRTPGDRPRP